MKIRPVREITSEEENFRISLDGAVFTTIKRDPVEPEPVGTLVACVFRITGYDPDCDGSLMARMEALTGHFEETGWEVNSVGLYPDTAFVVEHPDLMKLVEEER